MAPKATHLTKENIARLLRAASGVTQQDAFVMVGTGAVVARLKHVPLDLMRTREIHLSVEGAAAASDLVDGSIGEGLPFDERFGYYARSVGPRTAILPDGWRERAVTLEWPQAPRRALPVPGRG